MDSVNPSLVPGARGEAEAARWLCGYLRENGVAAELQEASDDTSIRRPNVVAAVGAPLAALRPAPGAGLLLVAHMDTVGAGDMPEPFTPRERDGRLYGRGALDIKSGVAAICAAAIAIARENTNLKKPLIIAAVVDEECNSLGTQKLVTEYSAEAAVVLEPTDLKLCVAHKGYAWLEVVAHGRAAHGSRHDTGRDAIACMGRVLAQMEELDRTLARRAPHPLLGRASVHASLIEGGHELSSYPAMCRLQIERRTLPGESGEEVEGEMQAILRGLAAKDPAFRAEARLLSSRAAYQIAPEAPIASAAAKAIGAACGAARHAGMSFWTDTALLAAAGVPGVVFGPAGQGLHGAEEYVELDSVTKCAEALRALALDWCG